MYQSVKKDFIDSMMDFRKIKDFYPRDPDLSPVEALALANIAMLGDSLEKSNVSASALRECLGVSKPAISQSLNSLEKKGFIERSISKEDRRSVSISLTKKGEVARNKSRKVLDNFLDQVIVRLGVDDFEKSVELLKKISTAIKEIHTQSNLKTPNKE